MVEMSLLSKLRTYFTAGRPVVAATDYRSGTVGLMTAADAERVGRPGDRDAVLSAIETLARNREGAETLGRNGQQYAAEHRTGDASLRRKTAWIRPLVPPDYSSRSLQRS